MQDVLELFSKPTAEWFAHTFGEPTQVQKESWPQIAAGRHVLVSAPTGTGKTLTAFLIFIDQLMRQSEEGRLEEGLQLIYISPLKSLAADIRENLRRPLDGIRKRTACSGEKTDEASALPGTDGTDRKKKRSGCGEISVAIRTGDTPQGERQRMVKHPPHILITTPESLFLMLTSSSGQRVLRTARAVVIDELHALIDTKRGAHLLFSVARLERLCGRTLQRIGLSATIEPPGLAAQWLSPEKAAVVAPPMQKRTEIAVVGTTPAQGRKKDPIWEELAKKVYDRCQEKRSVIAFSEGRRYAEKLAYYVNQIAGEDFARVHHGSLSKQQRFEVEESLRKGQLRLLCATSSMELGIDVGEIDEVLQIGCPRTISSTMQRLGRAGHSPGRVSVMQMYPRTAPEGLYCGMTAALALRGTVEEAKPPRLCLDVLAQHLVSMAAGGVESRGNGQPKPAAQGERDVFGGQRRENRTFSAGGGQETKEEAGSSGKAGAAGEVGAAGENRAAKENRAAGEIRAAAYSVDDVLALTKRTWPFKEVTRDMVKSLLCMLAGDFEHSREIPVRPRVLYDRIHEVVYPDPYSRMLAVAAGGTIPDKGLYAAKTLDGVKLGELDEEFVYESYVGDRFLLGSFGWRIVGQDKDTVYVEPAPADSARVPFWKGEIKGRSLKTGLAFGKMLGRLGRAQNEGELLAMLSDMGLDSAAAQNAADFIGRQIAATGCLPDDRTILVEHFCDHTGSHQIMIHSMFGRRINAPFAIVLQDVLREKYHMNTGGVDEEDGILLYPYGEEKMPEKIVQSVDPQRVRALLEAALPRTPLFSITFRYNAARALMMGMKRNGRQPLWMQRLRSTEMLDSLVREREHPLMVETRRECLEELWDIEGLLQVLSGIRSGLIGIREVYVDVPSPMSLPLQWQVEAAEMYSYAPVTPGIVQNSWEERKLIEGVKPTAQELENVQRQGKIPQNASELHTLLMVEGDLAAEELEWVCDGGALNGCCAQEAGGAFNGCCAQANGSSEANGCIGMNDGGAAEADLEESGGKTGRVAGAWLEELARAGQAAYIEPGLWIAAEQQEEYERALLWLQGGEEAEIADACENGEVSGEAVHILRRMLYYRGAADAERICQRYAAQRARTGAALSHLLRTGSVVEDDGIFYHAKLYERAQKATLKSLRREVVTQPAEHYAALMAQKSRISASPAEQLRETLQLYAGQPFAPGFWEEVLFPARVKNYRESLLDALLAEGDYFWHFLPDGRLCFERMEDVDWEADENAEENAGDEGVDAEKDTAGRGADADKDTAARGADAEEDTVVRAAGADEYMERFSNPEKEKSGIALGEDEKIICGQLKRRGASFLKQLSRCLESRDAQPVLLGLAKKGLVYADSFVPVRQSMNQEKIAKATARQRVNVRVQAMSAGRWDLVRPCRKKTMEEQLETLFARNLILCRETWRRSEKDAEEHMSWSDALAVLRVWEYVGKVRRGYFVAGLSGAQYIRQEDYLAVTQALAAAGEEIIWLNAADPACIWGKVLPYQEEKGFTGVTSTAVAQRGGNIVAVAERKGNMLRILEPEYLEETIAELAAAFRGRRLFAGQKRMVVKDYPAEAASALKAAGFIREMQDYVLYLS